MNMTAIWSSILSYVYYLTDNQKNSFGKDVLEETRYTGIERTDKSWVSTGLASAEAKEIAKFGDVLVVGEQCLGRHS